MELKGSAVFILREKNIYKAFKKASNTPINRIPKIGTILNRNCEEFIEN